MQLEQAGIRTLSVIGVAASSHNLVDDTSEDHAVSQHASTDDSIIREDRRASISETRYPSEHAIHVLLDMGFDRTAAIAALIASDNIVELAANLLVGEPFVAPLSASIEGLHCSNEAVASRRVAVIQAKRHVADEVAAEAAHSLIQEDMHETRRSRISISGLTSLWPSRPKREQPRHEATPPAPFSLLRFSSSHKGAKGKCSGEPATSDAVGAPGHPTNVPVAQLPSYRHDGEFEADDDFDAGSLSSEDVSPDEDSASDFQMAQTAAGAGLLRQYPR
jgi:hypothetical protein